MIYSFHFCVISTPVNQFCAAAYINQFCSLSNEVKGGTPYAVPGVYPRLRYANWHLHRSDSSHRAPGLLDNSNQPHAAVVPGPNDILPRHCQAVQLHLAAHVLDTIRDLSSTDPLSVSRFKAISGTWSRSCLLCTRSTSELQAVFLFRHMSTRDHCTRRSGLCVGPTFDA